MVAAYVVTQSNGKADIQTFSLPVFPILYEFDKAFKAAIAQWCPDCKVTEHPQQGSDIGTKTPQSVVSAVTRDPSTNWLIFDLGDLETGVDAALAAAGLHGLHIGGLTADTPNIEGLKNKTQDVWTAYSLPIVAYRQVDSFARKFENMADPQRGAAHAAAHAGQRELDGRRLGPELRRGGRLPHAVQEALAPRLAQGSTDAAGGRPVRGDLPRCAAGRRRPCR